MKYIKYIYELGIITLFILLGGWIAKKAAIHDPFLAACLPALGILIGCIVLKIIAFFSNRHHR